MGHKKSIPAAWGQRRTRYDPPGLDEAIAAAQRTLWRDWRIASEPGYVWYVGQPAFRGWRLLFLFSAGQLKDVELATAAYVSRCVVRNCTVYPPQPQARAT